MLGQRRGWTSGPWAPAVPEQQLTDIPSSRTSSRLASKVSRSPGQVKKST